MYKFVAGKDRLVNAAIAKCQARPCASLSHYTHLKYENQSVFHTTTGHDLYTLLCVVPSVVSHYLSTCKRSGTTNVLKRGCAVIGVAPVLVEMLPDLKSR